MHGSKLPFTVDAFFDVFARYNTAIWPLQIIAYLVGGVVIVAAMRPFRGSDRLISSILAALWIWVGAVYHLIYFRAINPAALIFGLIFILQGALFLFQGVIRQQLRYQARCNSAGVMGGLFVMYAMAIYPALGYMFGHVYPHAPMFGVAPCPLLVFTFGLLLVTTQRLPAYLLIIPSAWAILGLSAATALGVYQDLALIVAAVITVVVITVRNHRMAKSAPTRQLSCSTGKN